MSKQLALNIYRGKRGGRRPGAGRPRVHSSGVSHSKREKVSGRTPVHINFKVRMRIRNKACLKYLKRAIEKGRTHGLNVLHFSLQSNHIHLLAEAKDNVVLSRGMRALTISFAKSIGKGRIQLERYHLHVLKSIRETKNAIQYVLFNQQKHSGAKILEVDEFVSNFPYDLARNYIRKMKLRLVWRPGDYALDEARSFFFRRSISEMTAPASMNPKTI